jgi:SAM-dependent methyltransferase
VSEGAFREVWEERAEDWIGWARSRELDFGFWELNLPAMLELLPPPGRLTLDIACGEGRLSRELARLGHRVIGIDSSPSLLASAREAQGAGPHPELLLADAAALPLDDGMADLAVASMALMTVDDMPAVVSEVARVLAPGGRFLITVLHPVDTWGDAGGSYFLETAYDKEIVRDSGSMTFRDAHRPLSAYCGALEQAGFAIERVREPEPSEEYFDRHPDAARLRGRPFLLHLRAVLAP